MHLTVNSQTLAQELRLLSKIVQTKPAISILSYVLLSATDTLTLSATDLEVAMRATCQAEIQSQGQITLPAKKLLELIDRLPDADVTIALDAGQARVSCGAFKSRLQTLSADDFPTLPDIEGDVATVSATSLRHLLDRTAYAMPEGAQKFVMQGVLLSLTGTTMAAVATDGKRLSVAVDVRSTDGPKMSAILASKTVELLAAQSFVGDLEFSQSDRHLFFAMGDRLIISRMLEGQFPNYQRIIPQNNDKKIVIERAAFAAALRRVGLVSEQNSAIYLTLEHDSLLLATSSAEIGEADELLPASHSGNPLKLCANWTYLLDFVEHASETSITLEAKDANLPLLLTDGPDFINVVMGMRL